MAEKKEKAKGRKIPAKATAYKLEGNNISKVKKECPRCGAGTFMARHNDRSYCGRCHYTEFSQPPAQKQPQPQQQQPQNQQQKPQSQHKPHQPQQPAQQQQPSKKA